MAQGLWALLHPPYTAWHLSYVLIARPCAKRHLPAWSRSPGFFLRSASRRMPWRLRGGRCRQTSRRPAVVRRVSVCLRRGPGDRSVFVIVLVVPLALGVFFVSPTWSCCVAESTAISGSRCHGERHRCSRLIRANGPPIRGSDGRARRRYALSSRSACSPRRGRLRRRSRQCRAR